MPKLQQHMIEHPRQNLNNAAPLERTFAAGLVRRGDVLAVAWGKTPEEAAKRAAGYRLAYGNVATEIVPYEP